MSQTLHYRNVPITEAIIDLRVEPTCEPVADTLESVGNDEQDVYPERTPILMGTGYLQWGDRVSATASSSPLGTRFASRDGKVIWQARLDGFTISRLAPYHRWESFRDEPRGSGETIGNASNRRPSDAYRCSLYQPIRHPRDRL